MQQPGVELKADTIRILDDSSNSEPSEATQGVTEDVPVTSEKPIVFKTRYFRQASNT